MHTAPFALTFALLGFWLALGWAVQAIVKPRLAPLPSLLLSPLIGLSATLVPVFWLSLIGIPTAHFALPLTLVLVGVVAAGWATRRPNWRWVHLVPVGVVALAVLAIGVPTLVFGFDWVANANDDWANYNLGALRLVQHGMLHQPDIDAMLAGKDYPAYLYFLMVGQDSRPGAELLLAWTGALTHQNPFFIFMPVILGFYGVMICAAATLALRGARSRLHWFLGLLLAAAAPLSLYAVQQQLIAQVLGIAFTSGLAALACVRLSDLAGGRRLALVTLVAAAYLLAYPEMVPFFGLVFLVFHAAHARDRAWGWSRIWRVLAIPVGLAVLTGPYLVSSVLYLFHQFAQSASQGQVGGASIFPYFLVPSGAAVLWGLLPFASFPAEPWLSISIWAALALSVFTLAAAGVLVRRGSIVAGLLLLFVLVAVQLATARNDFGLFKIAMFAQPFLWFTVLGAVPGRRLLPVATAAVLGTLLILSDTAMTRLAVRDGVGGGIGITGASREHLLHRVLDNHDPRWCNATFETSNLPLIKVLAADPGCARFFPNRLTFSMFEEAKRWIGVNPLHDKTGIDDFVRQAASRLQLGRKQLTFHRLDGAPLTLDIFQTAEADVDRIGVNARDEGVIADNQKSIVSVQDIPQMKDHLEFVQSNIGDNYYLPIFKTVSTYAPEPDIYFIGKNFQAIGRYILLKVVSPTSEIRVQLDISETLVSNGSRQLPPAVIMGKTTVPVGLFGNGSARVLSPPLEPLRVGNRAYVLIDLGVDAKPLAQRRTGAMSLYGRAVALDYRSVAAFARRILAVDAAACNCEAAPASITDVGAALADPTLRYSGIYEDGWIGQDGFVRLGIDGPGKVEFRAMMPGGIGIARDEITVSVEGGESVTRSVVPGQIAIDLPVAAGPHEITWHFATAGVLPGDDGRAAAASLESVAVVKDVAPSSITDVKAALTDPALRHAGIYADGWMEQDGFVRLGADGPGKVEFRAMMPAGIGIVRDEITVSVEGGESVTRSVVPGQIAVDLPVAAGPHKIAWHFATAGILPDGDGRGAAARLESLAVAPANAGKADAATPASE